MKERGLIEEAESLAIQFWETYGARGPNCLNDLSEFFADEYIGHGTEKSESWLSKEDAINQLAREIELTPQPVSVSIRNIHSIQSGEVVVTMFDLSLTISFGEKVIEMDNIRFMSTMREIDGAIKFISNSASIFENSPGIGDSPWKGLEEPQHYDEVTILFADFQKFTNMVGTIPAKKLVSELRDIFSEFDDIIKRNGIYKIKTIGDAYMAVGGLFPDQKEHAVDTVQAALDMVNFIKERNLGSALKYDLRVGIHSGSVVGGTVGTSGLSFDIFGDSVNIASRVEQASEPGRICVSAYTYDLIKSSFDCEYRGKVDAKGKGPMDMYWVGTV